MSKGWGGKRANSGRRRVTRKVKHLRIAVLVPRDSLEDKAIKWFMAMKPEERLNFITKKSNGGSC